jgi:hypothetical protein
MTWIVQRPWAMTLILMTLTALATSGYVNPRWIADLLRPPQEFASGSNDSSRLQRDTAPNVDPVNLAGADAIVVVRSEDFFTPSAASTMRHVVDELESLEYVDRILWMDRVPILNIFGLPEPLLPKSNASPERFQSVKQKALDHPLVGGQLLSGDGKTLLLMVNFDWLFVGSDGDCTVRLKEVAERAANTSPENDLTFMVSGRVPMFVTAIQAQRANQWRYQLIGYGMIVVMALILFRGVTAVLIVAVAPSLGVFWTLGILRFFGLQENPFNDVVLPVLLSLVGLTDGVHMMVQIRRRRASGLSPQKAAEAGMREVGLACALTSLTTAIGFGSLTLAHHDIVREFGHCCVLGVILTFIAVVTTIPFACSTRLGRRVHVGIEKSLVDRNLSRIGVLVDLVLRRAKTFGAIGIVATLALVLTSLSLRPDERNSNALPIHSEAAVALRHMDQAMGGLEFSHVNITWSEDIEPDAPEVLTVVRKVDEMLRRETLIGHPLSIRNFIDALPGEGPPAERMSLLELLPPPLKRAYYTPEYRSASVSFRVQDLGIARYGPVFERLEGGFDTLQKEHSQFDFSMSGSAIWRYRNLYQIVVDLAASLGSAAVIIFIVLAIVYRSIRIGLISIIPNMFPLALTGAFLVVTGQALELVSVCAFTVCLGIAVDAALFGDLLFLPALLRMFTPKQQTRLVEEVNELDASASEIT